MIMIVIIIQVWDWKACTPIQFHSYIQEIQQTKSNYTYINYFKQLHKSKAKKVIFSNH